MVDLAAVEVGTIGVWLVVGEASLLPPQAPRVSSRLIAATVAAYRFTPASPKV
jgi:hypothetical protein